MPLTSTPRHSAARRPLAVLVSAVCLAGASLGAFAAPDAAPRGSDGVMRLLEERGILSPATATAAGAASAPAAPSLLSQVQIGRAHV